MDQEKREHFFAVLRNFSHAMLTTRSRDGGLHTRPMFVADVDKEGNIWLMSPGDSEKVDELAHDRHVNVSMQSSDQWVAIAGDAEMLRDKARIHALFKEPWKAYFPQGPDDPNVVLIKVNSVHGQYWDNAGIAKVKYMWQVAKAYVQGTTASHNKDTSGKVQLDA
jgi:general stress protein 26